MYQNRQEFNLVLLVLPVSIHPNYRQLTENELSQRMKIVPRKRKFAHTKSKRGEGVLLHSLLSLPLFLCRLDARIMSSKKSMTVRENHT